MEREAEILRLKDAIHDCSQHIKALELELDEKNFKYRCIPQKRKNATSMILKCIVPLVVVTLLAVVGISQAVSCLTVLLANGGAKGGGDGISLLIDLILGGLSTWGGTKLWIYVLRQAELLLDLHVFEKKSEREIHSLETDKEKYQRDKEKHEKILEELQYEQYLQEMSPEAELNMDNLRKYLDAKCCHIENIEKRIAAPEVIDELYRFGYRTIGSLESAFRDRPIAFFVPYDTTNYAGILRNIMIINDCNAYFEKAYRGGWLQTTYERMKFWKEKGVTDIERYLEDNEIHIKFG